MASDGWMQVALVMAGAGAGFVPGYLIERLRWKRDTHKEWQELRRDNVIGFLTIASRLTHETTMLGAALCRRPLPGDPEEFSLDSLPDEPAASRARMIDRLRDEITSELEQLKLIGSAEQVRLGKTVLSTLNDLTALAKRGLSRGDEEFTATKRLLERAKEEFRECVRRDLGVDRVA